MRGFILASAKPSHLSGSSGLQFEFRCAVRHQNRGFSHRVQGDPLSNELKRAWIYADKAHKDVLSIDDFRAGETCFRPRAENSFPASH